MKIFLLCILLFFAVKGLPQYLIGVYSATQLINNDLAQFQCESYYLPESDEVYLSVDGTNRNVIFILDKGSRLALELFMVKFKDWSKIADSAQVSADRLIGNLFCTSCFKIGK